MWMVCVTFWLQDTSLPGSASGFQPLLGGQLDVFFRWSCTIYGVPLGIKREVIEV